MAERASGLITILFTDLVGSTELLSRAGDEDAQRIFRAHHDLLAEVAASHGGEEVKWLGDGLMVAFRSAADAVSAAIAMQRASRRPVSGERLAIRAGLNAGEALRDATDYFGTTVVVARRLCDRAGGGQILASDVVAGLLRGRGDFGFSDLGKLDLKGMPEPVAACEVGYEAVSGLGLPSELPFVGREGELERLATLVDQAVAGRGGLVMVGGEPGIGKTRLAEELATRARRKGAQVSWGRCLEGDWAPPYGPFAEAVEALARICEAGELRIDLGTGAATLAQVVPLLQQLLPDVAEPVPVNPDEERFRVIDAMANFLLGRAQRAPLLLCLDDLQWADRASIAALHHVARLAPRSPLLILGTYRDSEVGPGHPLAEALGALRREAEHEVVHLHGLEAKAVGSLLEALAEHDVMGAVAVAIAAETDGNPFFIKEVLRHLVEEGRFVQGDDGRWSTDRPIAELGIPEGVREVIGRRLARLSEAANAFLRTASAFDGPFHFDVVASVARLSEDDALDALDESLTAQLVEPAGGRDVYGFTHALIRHTIYDGQSPTRQGRLHLRVAEALDTITGGHPSSVEAGVIAGQYHRAAGLPGAERGVEPALTAAAHAQATGAHDEDAGFLRMAIDLLPDGDLRRPAVASRLGISLIWALRFDEAVAAAIDAAGTLAASEGPETAAAYLADAAYAANMAGSPTHAWPLARSGLDYVRGRRDVAWAYLTAFDCMRREAEDAEHPGIPLEATERAEAARILRAANVDPVGPSPAEAVFATRLEALQSRNLVIRLYWVGEFAAILPALETEAEVALSRGQLNRAARCLGMVAICKTELGLIREANASLVEAKGLAARVGQPVFAVLQASETLSHALDEGLEELSSVLAPFTATVIPGIAWALGLICGWAARAAASLGREEEALRLVGLTVPWLERAPAWCVGMPVMAANACEVLWLLQRTDHHQVVERALRDKVVAPDFRSPMVDGRLALARLCALSGRVEEAHYWFDEARMVLTEQQARPLLAITDFDEALMYTRRGGAGDAERARPLLDAGRGEFEAIGMTGWLRWAERLSERLG